MSLENLPGSVLTIQERWIKLYRTIFHRWLREDFVNRTDYLKTIDLLNKRIDMLETTVNQNIQTTNASIQSAIVGHTHMVPQAPAGTLPSMNGIIASPIVAPPPSKGTPVQHLDTALIKRDLELVSIGPAMAPLGDGISSEAAQGTAQAVSDIGLE